MRILKLAFIALLALGPIAARADVTVLPDPDKWIETALQDISQGKTDDFARNYLKLIDKSGIFDSFSGNLRVLSRIGPPVFVEKVQDTKYGAALREVFAKDVTAALATCIGCGLQEAVGALLEYGQSMGVILRCPRCDTAMLRVVRTPGWLRIDASGISLLMMPDDRQATPVR